jgi:hypothetical protein
MINMLTSSQALAELGYNPIGKGWFQAPDGSQFYISAQVLGGMDQAHQTELARRLGYLLDSRRPGQFMTMDGRSV